MQVYNSPTYIAFIAAICANPDDDLPRLVCADWLREQGEDARADFIQCQLEKAELERASGGKLPVKELPWAAVQPIAGTFDIMVNSVRMPEGVKLGDVVALDGKRNDEYTVASAEVSHELQAEPGPGLVFADGRIPPQSMRYVGNRIVCYHLQKAPPCPLRDRWRELERLEGELLGLEDAGDFAVWDLPTHVINALIDGDGKTTYSRGFLESIRIRVDDWIDHNAEILKRNPVRRVTLILAGHNQWEQSELARWWPGIEFTFERESEYQAAYEMGRRLAEQRERQILEALTLPPGLYYGNESITVDG